MKKKGRIEMDEVKRMRVAARRGGPGKIGWDGARAPPAPDWAVAKIGPSWWKGKEEQACAE